MDHLFLMDPLEGVSPRTDTTWALMGRAAERGEETSFAHPSSLALLGGELVARARRVRVDRARGRFEWLGPAEWRDVSSFGVAWLRKDPPFDLRYLEATWLLEHVDRGACRVVNDPGAVRGANEKLYALRFPDLAPPSLVTSDPALLRAFVEEYREVVLKPLGGAGGEGIVFADARMRGLRALLELATSGGQRREAQAYLSRAREGDKRILLLDGEPLGAVLRIHGEGEERNNLHLGGRAERCTLGARDLQIVERLAPSLRADGLWLVGIDVIDGHLTEVNVTSPTGLQELERLDGVDAAGRILDWALGGTARDQASAP